MTSHISTGPGWSGFGPKLALSYNSDSGNGLFGLGWSLSLSLMNRKTNQGLLKRQDGGQYQVDSDVNLSSGALDLVPIPTNDSQAHWILRDVSSR
jgi:Salmonella virulence plasmid 65kDa B protein.